MDAESDATEPRLVRAFRAGDAEAFRTLFHRLAPALRGRVGRRLPARYARRLSIADILQEVSIVAFKRHGDFTGETVDDLRNWLLGIADMKVRKAIDRHGKTQKRRLGSEVSHDERIATADAVGGPSPSQVAIGHELRDAARNALAGLAPDHRDVLRMVQFEGLDLAEVAARMGRSYAAVQKLHERALYRFTEAFDTSNRSRHG